MIECPNCKAKLPDWAKTCQFCQADTGSVLRPQQQYRDDDAFRPAGWVWTTYYIIAGWYVIEGGIGLYQILRAAAKGFGFFTGVGLVLYGVTALIGLGLLGRVEVIRNIVNFFCGLQIIFGILGLASAILGTLVTGPWGVLVVLYQIVSIATAGLMIYLIGETDRLTANV